MMEGLCLGSGSARTYACTDSYHNCSARIYGSFLVFFVSCVFVSFGIFASFGRIIPVSI